MGQIKKKKGAERQANCVRGGTQSDGSSAASALGQVEGPEKESSGANGKKAGAEGASCRLAQIPSKKKREREITPALFWLNV